MNNDRDTVFGTEELADLEERLRVAMNQEARDVEPDDRLDQIRRDVDDAQVRPHRRHAWLLPVGAAAAVAAIAVVAWLGLRPGATPSVPVAPGTTTASPSSTPSAPTSAATSAATTSSPATSAPPALAAYAAPVYFVQAFNGGTRWGVVREFLGTQVPAGAGADAKATAAVNLALNAEPFLATDGYAQSWPAGTTGTVRVTTDEIRVVLSNAGVPGLPAEQQRVAVQQVVWTVTAAAGKTMPVRVSVPDSGSIFETMPSTVYKRPAAADSYRDIAPIWVDSPSRGQVLPASASVVVTGQACTFEANVAYELKRGATVVKQGSTTAKQACPTQSAWSVDVGRLPAGEYSFRAFEASAETGKLTFQKVVTFTVR